MTREQQPWLDVPFAEKDAAKAAGAQWDRRARRWYAPRPGMAELARWLPAPRAASPPAGEGVGEDLADRAHRPAGPSRPPADRLAEALRGLTEPGTLTRLVRRRPPWRVLHAVPLGTGQGEVDHVLIGPPGVVLVAVGEVRDGAPEHLGVAVERAGRLLAAALGTSDPPPVSAALVVPTDVPDGEVPPGVRVTTVLNLPWLVTALPAVLADDEVDELYAAARRLGTWTREL